MEEKSGTIWNVDFFKAYKQLTDDIFYLPGVSRESVKSLWTPNVRYIEITPEGTDAQDVITSYIQADSITDADIEGIKGKVIRGGFLGRVVSSDMTGALVVMPAIVVVLDTVFPRLIHVGSKAPAASD